MAETGGLGADAVVTSDRAFAVLHSDYIYFLNMPVATSSRMQVDLALLINHETYS